MASVSVSSTAMKNFGEALIWDKKEPNKTIKLNDVQYMYIYNKVAILPNKIKDWVEIPLAVTSKDKTRIVKFRVIKTGYKTNDIRFKIKRTVGTTVKPLSIGLEKAYRAKKAQDGNTLRFKEEVSNKRYNNDEDVDKKTVHKLYHSVDDVGHLDEDSLDGDLNNYTDVLYSPSSSLSSLSSLSSSSSIKGLEQDRKSNLASRDIIKTESLPNLHLIESNDDFVMVNTSDSFQLGDNNSQVSY